MRNYIFDFDSTIIKLEGLDVLAEIVSKDNPKIIDEIKAVSILGMEGKIDFAESLKRRIQLLKSHKNDIADLVYELKRNISDSFERNRAFVENNKENCYVVSGGFQEYVIPVCMELGFKPSHIYANRFVYDSQGMIIDVDTDIFLAKNGGKSKLISTLNLTNTIMIGDGYTDYETKADGVVDVFIAFTENIERQSVIDVADVICTSLDEVILRYS